MAFPLVILILSIVMNQANSVDIVSLAGSALQTKELMSCYTCRNISKEHCTVITNESLKYAEECLEGATGCVKKLYEISGSVAMSRSCYYGPKKFVDLLECEGPQQHYNTEKCFVCSENLCNSTTPIYVISNVFCTLVFSMICLVLSVFAK